MPPVTTTPETRRAVDLQRRSICTRSARDTYSKAKSQRICDDCVWADDAGLRTWAAAASGFGG
jgi:hypothetical protein